MSLTGAPLIVLAFLGTVATAAATILIWIRGRRPRHLLRTAGVLLTEALLMLSVGLVVNRSQGFYPSWAALLQTASTSGTAYATRAGQLDSWLRAHTGPYPGASVAFTWQPTGWTGWHLAGAPIVVTPVAYLQHPAWRYSALLVIDRGAGGWAPATEAAAARDAGVTAGAAIMVFARTTTATSADTLAAALPTALADDLRVTGRRWALVASAADTGLASQAVVASPARYPALALVAGAARPVPPPLPAGIATAFVGATAAARTAGSAMPATVRPVYLAAGAATALRTALIWACQQTPPPLAASTPPVTHLPVHRRRPHPSPADSSPGPGKSTAGFPSARIHPGGKHGPGQPGH